MGTALAGRDDPDRVEAIHRDAVIAGAQIVTTNTFLIDEDRLEPASHGVAWARAGIAAAGHQREDAGRVRIAGSIGALGRRCRGQLAKAYRRIARALVSAGADVVFVETVIDVDDAQAAVEGIAEAIDIPLWISVACGPDGGLLGRGALGELPTRGVDAIVIGCTEHVGLAAALAALPKGTWRGVQPSTGLTIDGRFVPDAADARIVAETVLELSRSKTLALAGGCCGTTSDYVATLAAGLHADPRARAAAFDALDAHLVGAPA